ncbi:MAG TPA: hypothetical protein VNP92_25035 [Actinophytocola sp.]|nr:hypothetical protein [Actinophytocola sp.]
MLFWGRAGKLLQPAAGLVVVLDLDGVARLTRIPGRDAGWVGDFSWLIGT